VELDPSLIAAGTAANAPATDFRYVEADLEDALEQVLAPPLDLVTASALIDLCSAGWLERLVAATLEARAALLMALSYDGRIALEPSHPLDPEMVTLVNRHQRRDKGLGPALGLDAARHLAGLIEAAPGTCHVARSDWRLGPGDEALHAALLDGWAAAAAEVDPRRRGPIERWRAQRLNWVRGGRGKAIVGHEDILFLPP
jgi:hypothetical protein